MSTSSAVLPTRSRPIAWLTRGSASTVAARVFLLVVGTVALLAPFLPLQDYAAQDLGALLQPPSSSHWFGTDDLGRDLFSRTVFGTRTSLFAALIAVGTAGLIGVPFGLLAGMVAGGRIDTMISRVADAVMAVPPLILTLAAVAALGRGIALTMFVLGLVLAPRVFRVVRASALVVNEAGYMEAGRLSGCSTVRLMTAYVYPNVRDQVYVQVSLLLGYAILVEAGLSFLGLGVSPPEPSLGVLLRGGTGYLETASFVVLIPGAVLTGLILSANVLGDDLAQRSIRGTHD